MLIYVLVTVSSRWYNNSTIVHIHLVAGLGMGHLHFINRQLDACIVMFLLL